MRILAFTMLISMSSLSVHAQETPLFSCKLNDPWLQTEKTSAELTIMNMDQAKIIFRSGDDAVSCPLEVESIRDASRAVVAEAIFKLHTQACSPTEKNFNKYLRSRITLNVSTQPGVPPSAQLAWKNRSGFIHCEEILNNLKSIGIGNRLPQSTKTKSNKKGTN